MTPLELKIATYAQSILPSLAEQIMRPLLPLELRRGSRSVACFGIVDSGADSCVFPARFMKELGIDSAHSAPTSAVTGPIKALVERVTIAVTDDRGIDPFEADVGFSEHFDAWGFQGLGVGLLGQLGFFDKFKITFDRPRNRFYLEESGSA